MSRRLWGLLLALALLALALLAAGGCAGVSVRGEQRVTVGAGSR